MRTGFMLWSLFLAALMVATCGADERKEKLASLLADGAVVYYGREPQNKSRFTSAKLVIIEPAHWTTRSMRRLKEDGKTVIGYLSVGELISTTRTRRNYRVLSQNDAWNSFRIDPADPDWQKTMLRRTRLAAERELDGIMLDTVDIAILHPEVTSSMVDLIKKIRNELPRGYLLMNRGFSVVEELGNEIDGVVFENANNNAFSANDKEWVEAQCERLRSLEIPVLILDYEGQSELSDTRELAEKYGWSFYRAESTALTKPPFKDQ